MLFSKPAMMKVSVPTTNVAMVSGMSNFTELDVGVVFIFLPYHLCDIWSIVFNCHRMLIVIFVTCPLRGKVGLGHHAPVDRSRQVDREICRALPDSCEECFRCWYSDCDERFI